MKIKPANRPGGVVLEVGPRDSTLLSNAGLLTIHKILVPVDFSELSTKAMDYALAFARQFNAEVILVHVVDIPPGIGDAGIELSDRDLRELQQQDLRQLEELAEARRHDGVTIRSLLRTGAADHEIIDQARSLQVDLIILATHGRRGLTRFFLGSTTERVVRHAPCPVLVVREKEHEFVA